MKLKSLIFYLSLIGLIIMAFVYAHLLESCIEDKPFEEPDVKKNAGAIYEDSVFTNTQYSTIYSAWLETFPNLNQKSIYKAKNFEENYSIDMGLSIGGYVEQVYKQETSEILSDYYDYLSKNASRIPRTFLKNELSEQLTSEN